MSLHRTRTLLGVPVLLAVVLLTVVACSSSKTGSVSTETTTPTTSPASRRDLTSGSWQLVSYQGASGPVAAASSPSTLSFGAAGSLTGTTGCNRFTGRYTTSGGTLTLDPGAMTQMACADPAVEAQEAAIGAGFPKVTGSAITGDQLTLTDATGATLFTYTAQATGLPGTSWTATGVNNGKGAVASTSQTEHLTLTFGDGGQLSGFGGCNQLTGTYQVADQGNGLTISGLASTKKACPADVMALEAEYTAALGNVARYEMDAGTLTLRAADGATQATFVAGS